MSPVDLTSSADRSDTPSAPLSDRLSLGVAARLSRYLQVLTQARKEGMETISSQELSKFTHVNSTQIRYAYTDKFRFASQKAATELGYSYGPLEPAIADALGWFRANGMA